MTPLGIYGGTFDPVHFGHLRTALELHEGLGLAAVRLLPCRLPPHRGAPGATPAQRLAMLELALAATPGLAIDDRELRRDGPSYMVDTLRSLRAEEGARPLALILGSDAFAGLERWHRWEELIELAHLLVMTRPGGVLPQEGPVAALLRQRRADARALTEAAAGAVVVQPVTALEISATRIRALIAAGRSPRFLLPEAVERYIRGEGLYRGG